MNAIHHFPHSPQELTSDDLDALRWADLATIDDSTPKPEPVEGPLFIGCVNAEQRGVNGVMSLEVMLDFAGQWIEIGPFRLHHREAVTLCLILRIVGAIGQRPLPESGRGITGWDLACNLTGQTQCPWEGESLP